MGLYQPSEAIGDSDVNLPPLCSHNSKATLTKLPLVLIQGVCVCTSGTTGTSDKSMCKGKDEKHADSYFKEEEEEEERNSTKDCTLALSPHLSSRNRHLAINN